MKTLRIVALMVAGGLGGAVVMKVAQRPRPMPPAPVVAQVPAPLPKPAVVEASTPVPQAAIEPPAPEPLAEPVPAEVAPAPRRIARPIKTARAPYIAAIRAPAPTVAVPAEPEPAPPAPQVAAASPAASAPSPVPLSIPPARVEAENATPPPPAPPEPHRVTLNAGTQIPVRLVDGLTAERSKPGDSFAATLDKELVAEGFVIAERGARVEGRVVKSERGELQVELVRLHLSDGQTVDVQTDPIARRAEDSGRPNAAGTVGAGAVIGMVIGAAAGGGKGAAIGAGVGGAAGAGGAIATRAKPLALPSETRIVFRLRQSVALTERVGG